MNEFIWNDRYLIGSEEVDSQHRYLFELANQLVEATRDDEITRLLMLFYQHAREHFSNEEALMKRADYPGYLMHVEAHNQMLSKLVDISQTIQQKQWNPSDIKVFVTRWVLVHILEDDMPLGEYLKLHDIQPKNRG